MPLAYPMRVRDPVHGMMLFTRLEKDIIDLPVFQRLRGLKQSSLANYTYPTALTSRFEHSLGATHVGGQIIDHLFASSDVDVLAALLAQIRDAYSPPFEIASDQDLKDVIAQAVRLACLFHDIGHLPFSHCFEDAIANRLRTDVGKRAWGETYAREFDNLATLYETHTESELKLHEYIGFAIARDHPDILTVVNQHGCELAHQIAIDIIMSVANKEGSAAAVDNVLARIVHGEHDADRMDFVRRDAGMAGTLLGVYDLENLIHALALRADGGRLEVAPLVQGMSALEGFFTARLAIYRWQYHHHNVAYYDLLLKIIVRAMLNDQCGKDLGTELWSRLAIGNLLRSHGSEEPTADGWIVADDGLLWSLLMKLYGGLRRGSITMSGNLGIAHGIMMLEELLFRQKQHIALWKDPIGFRLFSQQLFQAMVSTVSKRTSGKTDSIVNILNGLARAYPHGVEESERLALMVTKALAGESELSSVQGHLLRQAVQGAEGGRDGRILIECKKVKPFSRLAQSDLSKIEVFGRSGEGDRKHNMTHLSDILRGMNENRMQEVRLFAYVLVGPASRKLSPTETRTVINTAKLELAQCLADWAIDHPGVIPRDSKVAMGLASVT